MEKNPLTLWGRILETWINPFKHIGPATAMVPARSRDASPAPARRKPPLMLSRASKCVWQLDREG